MQTREPDPLVAASRISVAIADILALSELTGVRVVGLDSLIKELGHILVFGGLLELMDLLQLSSLPVQEEILVGVGAVAALPLRSQKHIGVGILVAVYPVDDPGLFVVFLALSHCLTALSDS